MQYDTVQYDSVISNSECTGLWHSLRRYEFLGVVRYGEQREDLQSVTTLGETFRWRADGAIRVIAPDARVEPSPATGRRPGDVRVWLRSSGLSVRANGHPHRFLCICASVLPLPASRDEPFAVLNSRTHC